MIISPISCGPGTWAQLGWWLWLGHSHDAVVKLQAGATAIGRAGECVPKLIHRTVIRSLSSFPRETLPEAAHAAWQLAAPRVRDLREGEMEGAPPVCHHALPNIHLVINRESYLIALSLLPPTYTITTDPLFCTSSVPLTPRHFSPFCWMQDAKRAESEDKLDSEAGPQIVSHVLQNKVHGLQGLPASPDSVLHGPPHHCSLLSLHCFVLVLKFNATSSRKLFCCSDKIAPFPPFHAPRTFCPHLCCSLLLLSVSVLSGL